jgi:CheY-like chemotaxis protein
MNLSTMNFPTRTPSVRKVLVVDDNVDGANALALLVGTLGHTVMIAHTGHTAMRLARSTRPEVVLLDVVLPDMDGCDIAMRLRQEYGSAMKIIAVTGFGNVEDRERVRAAGFDQHVVKPMDPDFLRSLLG